MRNTKDTLEFVKDTCFWCFISMFWYRKSLFRSLPGLSLAQSKTVLWIIFFSFMIAGLCVTIRHRRNGLTVLTITLSIYEAYTIISYYRTFPKFFFSVFCAACFLAFLVYFRALFRRRFKHEATKSRASDALAKAHVAMILACSVIVLPLFISFGLDDSLVWSTVTSSKSQDSTEWTVANNIEIVGNLREDVWQELSASEKVDTLQVIANIEQRYLGLPHELNVIVSHCREHTLACYDDSTHTITINIEFFDDQTAHEMLDSICHECFHSYQHRLCEMYDDVDVRYSNLLLFDDIQAYISEFADYADGYEDSSRYYSQMCELRARQYAQQSVYEYYMRLSQFYGSSAHFYQP